MADFSISHADLRTLLAVEGDSTAFGVVGRPGIGKSSVLYSFDQTKYRPIMIDVAVMEPGDLMVPVITEDKRSVRYAVNELFALDPADTRIPVICLDEFAKGSTSVQASLLPMLHEHRLFNHKLPEGSIVFLTFNSESDAVGDSIHAHAVNRLCLVTLRGPDAREWAGWASTAGIHPDIISFAMAYPTVFEDYNAPGAENNPYIFNPKRGRITSFVSPRSLASLSRSMDAYYAGKYSLDQMLAVANGKIGEAASNDLRAHLTLASGIPTVDDAIENPKAARMALERLSLPAAFVFTARAATAATKESAVMLGELVGELHDEALQLYMMIVMTRPQVSGEIMRPGSKLSSMVSELAGVLRA